MKKHKVTATSPAPRQPLAREIATVLAIKLAAMVLIYQVWFANPVDEIDTPEVRAAHLLGAAATPIHAETEE